MGSEKKTKEKKQKPQKKATKQGSLWQLVMIIAILVLSIVGMTGLLVKNSQGMVTKLSQLKSDDIKFQQHAEAAYNSFLNTDAKSNMWVGLGVGDDRFGDDALFATTQAQAQEGSVDLSDNLQALQKLAMTATEKDHVDKALTDLKAYMSFFDQIQSLNMTDHHKAQQMQFVDNKDAANFLSQDLQKILEDASARMVDHSDSTLQAANFANQVNEYGGSFLVLLSLICLLFTWRTTNPIVKAVAKINAQLQRIAQGDLMDAELKVKARGEIKQLVQAVNQMTYDLRNVILHVKETAMQVAASSEQLNASAEMTNRASEEIAGAINEIASGSEQQVEVVEAGQAVLLQINDKIMQISDNAETATNRAAEAAQVATDGSHAVQSAVEQMNSINRAMEHLQLVIRGLGERSVQIGRIVEAITEIAGQTNLLALNAAIESARAGEQGRGFAVVADEVRKLAEQSTESAQEIGKYITQIQAEIQEAVQTMETSAREVKSGTGVVYTVGESFDLIQQTVDEVARQIRDVSAASLEMTSSTALTDTMGKIAAAAVANARGTQQASAVTEEQVATMQEIAASTAALSQMADELQELVEKFRV